MRLTPQQRAAVDESERHVLVIACPGSGKTRTIIARLIRAIEQVRGTPRRIACITYTNAAANEIESRLRALVGADESDYCDIGTIHAFCLKAVLRQYAGELPGYENGFAVAPPDSDEYQRLALEAIAQCKLGSLRSQEFENVRRGVKGEPLIPSDVAVTDECVRVFWTLLRDHALMDFPSITYLTYALLAKHPHLATTVSSRYREFLIDEMQDTDTLQVELLKRLAAPARSRFVMVGDPMQSILGFAGAEPKRMMEFAAHLNARTDFQLLDNWRSSARIVSLADAVCARSAAMKANGPDRGSPHIPVVIPANSVVDAVAGGFLPLLEKAGIPVGQSAVLAYAWYLLVPVAKELRRMNVPVSGPGARPYHRRGRLLTGLLENLCACMEDTRPDLLRRVQYELFDVIRNTESAQRLEVWERSGRLAIMHMIFDGRELTERYQTAIPWIEHSTKRFADILGQHHLIGTAGRTAMMDAAKAIIADIRTNRDVDPDELTVRDLGTFANPDGSMKLLTFHAAKGREFDAACVVSLEEGKMPHPKGNIDESRRVLYVAVTRPRKLLVLSHLRSGTRSRFLGEPAVQAALR